MRIAFVAGEYVTEEGSFDGGLANYIHRVSLSLAAMGHEPIVVVASDRDESFVETGIEVHRVRTSGNVWRGWIDFITFHRFTMALELTFVGVALRNRLKEIHRKRPLSIVQYTHLGGLSLFAPREIPSVVRLSSYTPLARAMGGYDGLRPCEIRQQEQFERRALKRADGVFGPSRIISALVEKDVGRPVEIIESPFLMDTSRTDDSRYRAHLEGKTYLLFFGTLSVLKGIVTLAEVIPGLLTGHPDLHFVFIGKERDGYRGMSMKDYILSTAGDCRDRVLFLGKMRHAQLYPILNRALAVVLPSRLDNFPNTCLEAMAHRRVIVGTRGTSFEQLLDDGESGILCEVDDPASLRDAVERAVALPDDRRREMGEKAWERVRELRPERAAAQLLSFYDKVVSGEAGRWAKTR
jgi:glycosyltransferase involved in cell wall biosynthesis